MAWLLTIAEVAELYRVPASQVAAWVRRGALPGVRLPNGQLRVHEEDLQYALRPIREPLRGEGRP